MAAVVGSPYLSGVIPDVRGGIKYTRKLMDTFFADEPIDNVTYVSNTYKYYIAYRLVLEERERRAAAAATSKSP